jgi:MtrB/PioB family decaheme-associated outer membrane protein
MRISGVLLVVALALVPATASAQIGDIQGVAGTIDFGVRGTDLSGDPARYERYRDLGDGLFMDRLRLYNNTDRWWVSLTGDHVGREDMRYRIDAIQHGTLKVWGMYDQIPLLMNTTTRTLFIESEFAAGLNIDSAVRAAYAGGNESARRALFDGAARTFDLKTTRYITEGGAQWIASPSWTVNALLRHTNRKGAIPLGGSFGHSSLVEMPGSIRHRTTDIEGNAEYASGNYLVRVGATGSLFDNEVTQFSWDNPFITADRSNASAAGRQSMAPSSSYLTVNGMLTVKLPNRSRFTAYAATGSLSDSGAFIMPQTINSALVTSPLERGFVDGTARTNAANLTFTSRPNRTVGVDVRYRLYDYDNQTPVFDVVDRVAYDYSRSSSGLETEPQSVKRHSITADLLLDPMRRASFGVGYFGNIEDRTHRIFEQTQENGLRAWFDTVSMATFSVRTKWEYSQKRTDTPDAEVAEFLSHFGEQPVMRHFDLAERDRNRVTVLANLSLTDSVLVNASVAAGKDDYVSTGFGLRDNTHGIYTVGFDSTPTDLLSYGMSYSFENYKAMSLSRQANPRTVSNQAGCSQVFPPPAGGFTCEFDDPRRDWGADSEDKVHSFLLNVAARGIGDVFDIVLGYDFNKADSTYEYRLSDQVPRTEPEDVVFPPTLDQPTELPPVHSQFNRLTSDFIYAVNDRVSIGFSYWLEDYDVEDFTLDAESNENLVRGNVLLLGYLYRPYTASTYWGRIIFRF